MLINKKNWQTIWFNETTNNVSVIDQRQLPHKFSIKEINSSEDAVFAIKEMVVRGAPLSTLFSSRLILEDTWGVGCHYQPGALFGVFASLKFESEFSFNYGYDFATSGLSAYSSGNHFFTLSYKFGYDKRRVGRHRSNYSDRVYFVR